MNGNEIVTGFIFIIILALIAALAFTFSESIKSIRRRILMLERRIDDLESRYDGDDSDDE